MVLYACTMSLDNPKNTPDFNKMVQNFVRDYTGPGLIKNFDDFRREYFYTRYGNDTCPDSYFCETMLPKEINNAFKINNKDIKISTIWFNCEKQCKVRGKSQTFEEYYKDLPISMQVPTPPVTSIPKRVEDLEKQVNSTNNTHKIIMGCKLVAKNWTFSDFFIYYLAHFYHLPHNFIYFLYPFVSNSQEKMIFLSIPLILSYN